MASLEMAAHVLERLRSVAHVRALELMGYAGSRDVHLGPGTRIIGARGMTLGEKVHLARDVKIECVTLPARGEIGRLAVEERVFVGERTTISCYLRITIGRLTMIGHGCSIVDSNHGTALGTPMREQPGQPKEVTIGEDCWLGMNVTVLPGVTIGGGTIVGAGSVVTRSLPENVMAAGVPARVIRPR